MSSAASFYRVDLDRRTTCAMIAREQNWQGFDEYAFTEPGYVTSWPNGASTKVDFVVEERHTERLMDYLDIPPRLVAVSSQARSIIESVATGSVQFLPILAFHRADGRSLGTYWVMNVLDIVSGLSFPHTKWIGHPSTPAHETAVANILRPALVGEAVKGHHLFRLMVNRRPFRLFASEQLRQALIADNAADGFGFERVLVI